MLPDESMANRRTRRPSTEPNSDRGKHPMRQRRTVSLILSTAVLALGVSGCASKPSNRALSGTWQGRAENDRPFTFGSVTFAGDGTYTAEAKYGDKTRVQSGRFVVTENGVVLDPGTATARTYDLNFAEGTVTFTDPISGNAMTLDRFR
jgi:hypothetical protein